MYTLEQLCVCASISRVVYKVIHYIWNTASIYMVKWPRTWSCTDLEMVMNSIKSIWKEKMEINCTEYKSGCVLTKLGQAATEINQNRNKACTELSGWILYCFKQFLCVEEIGYTQGQMLRHLSSLEVLIRNTAGKTLVLIQNMTSCRPDAL